MSLIYRKIYSKQLSQNLRNAYGPSLVFEYGQSTVGQRLIRNHLSGRLPVMKPFLSK